MTKAALLVPYESILRTADKVIEEHGYNITYKKVIRTEDSVNEARLAIEAGARIIIARGRQAKLIKEYTNSPLVEMRFHVQKIGLLIKRVKEILKKESPVIGLIVFENMLCDMSHMEELFNVTLHIRNIEQDEEVPGILKEMCGLGVEMVIGGEMVCREAQEAGFMVLPYESTEESIQEALQIAERMSFATETEKETKAQFEAVLDTAFHGIIKVDAQGKIIPPLFSFRGNPGFCLRLLFNMMIRYRVRLFRFREWKARPEAEGKKCRMYIFRALRRRSHSVISGPKIKP